MGKNKKKRTINVTLLISIIAIVFTGAQLYFTLPFVLDQYENVELEGYELGMRKHRDSKNMETSFLISNTGENTAQNVELRMRVFKEDKVTFVPDIFDLVKGQNKNAPVLNLIFRCSEIVPEEQIKIYVRSNFKTYLNFYKIDTLEFDKPIALNEYLYGPTIVSLKHSKGMSKINRQDSILLNEADY